MKSNKRRLTKTIKSKRTRRAAPVFNAKVIAQPPIPSYLKRSVRRFWKKSFRKSQPSYGGGVSFSSAPQVSLLALPGPPPTSTPKVTLRRMFHDPNVLTDKSLRSKLEDRRMVDAIKYSTGRYEKAYRPWYAPITDLFSSQQAPARAQVDNRRLRL